MRILRSHSFRLLIHNLTYYFLCVKEEMADELDTAKFFYALGENTIKIKTPGGIRLQIEAYSCLDGIIVDDSHFLRLRRASHSSQDHKVTLKLDSPDSSIMCIERTLVFNRGTTLLNLKISKDEILLLVGSKRNTKLLGELIVQQWKRSTIETPRKPTGTYVPKNKDHKLLCVFGDCDCLKCHDKLIDLGLDMAKWHQEVNLTTLDC